MTFFAHSPRSRLVRGTPTTGFVLGLPLLLALAVLPACDGGPIEPRASDVTLVELGIAGEATATDELGRVVGALPGGSRPFLWMGGDVSFLAEGSGWANDVNGTGQVVGIAIPEGAFLWSDGSARRLRGGLSASAVNEGGDAVGWIRVSPDDVQASLWPVDGGRVDLGTLNGGSSYAFDVNDSRQVVGVSTIEPDRPNLTRAFLWRDGTMVDLGTRIGDVASEASDINDAGVVVGKSRETLIDFQGDRAVMWVPAR